MAIFDMCRICLTEETNRRAMQPLFEDDENCTEIVQKIEECGGIILKPHEEFPKMICSRCLDYLNTSYTFRSMCQASEHALLDAIVKSEMKTEPGETQKDEADEDDEDEHMLQPDEHTEEIFLDLNSEFIEAKEVNFIEITGADETDIITEVEESEDEEFVVASASESDDTISDEETASIRRRVKQGLAKKSKSPRKMSNTPAGSSGRPKRLQRAVGVLGKAGRKKTDPTTPGIMCEICGNIYSKRSLLNMHMRRHMANKPFECEICGKTFACPSEIGRHIRVHTGEKPYVCKYCGRTFADRSTNIKHERIHTNERPFTCKTCGKSFTYSNVLKNHMLTHTGEKPFPCIPCNKTFSRKHQLDQHCSTITHQQTVKNLSAHAVDDEEDDDVKHVIVGELLSVTEMAE